MQLTIAPDAAAAAEAAAVRLAEWIAEAAATRGRASIALSGGTTPWQMLERLRARPLPWARLHVFQVDERAVPADDERRNAKRMRALLCGDGPLPPANFHPMPVEDAALEAAAGRYAALLAEFAGTPPVLDVAQLGLGPDGHTASLVPGDALLDVTDRDVAISAPYQGTPRMTLMFPPLDRARHVLWLVTGGSKAGMLRRLAEGDRTIPAGRVARERALVVADAAAGAELPSGLSAPASR